MDLPSLPVTGASTHTSAYNSIYESLFASLILLIRLQPNEPTHAEVRLNKYFHAYLMEVVFTPTAHKEYVKVWDEMEIPHGWSRPQNPVTHKGSMQFNEHARLGVVQPFVLFRLFAKLDLTKPRKYIRAPLWKAFYQKYPGQSFPELLIETAFLLAKSTYLAHKPQLSRDEGMNIHHDIMRGKSAQIPIDIPLTCRLTNILP